jgi:tRNA nucleotidyltransferase (CCA-adding enzyme)
MKFYEVGGAVRDAMLGLKSKDIDIAVEASSYDEMLEWVTKNTSKIFLEKREFFTIRALDKGEVKDFVLCRKDGKYSDSRRPDEVSVGTIFDDLQRRDFTVNAMAIDLDSKTLYDPFGGREDLQKKLLRCVGSAEERISEDSLRLIRAIRFCVTKGFHLDGELCGVLDSYYFWLQVGKLPNDRIRDELMKCFRHSTPNTLKFIAEFCNPLAFEVMCSNGLWLKPTTEEK